MFDVGFWELSLIGVLGLVILGPERLPVVARTLGGWVRRGRRYMRNFAEEVTGDESISELRSEVQKMRSEIEGNRDDDDQPGSSSSSSGGPKDPYSFSADDVMQSRHTDIDGEDSADSAEFDDQDDTNEFENTGAEARDQTVDEAVDADDDEDEDDEAVYARARKRYARPADASPVTDNDDADSRE